MKTPIPNVHFPMIESGRIQLRGDKGKIKLPIKNILFLESEINYTLIYTTDGKKYLSAYTLGIYETLLNSKAEFIRTHRDTLVNMNYAEKVEMQSNRRGMIKMNSGRQIQVSRRKMPLVIERNTQLMRA
ncbi:LytR/AlgR family response regulator transcription factor [Emticicia agri]|uniref:LytTR family transcriptional regulator n=1 Tax=Emticicia agri TaxID=2492393 RepID=A0A4Q5M1T7_9BACT|nr:LytTR family DNA-binding domain-containing protein [Emticicia agri]RYU96015.1 LytTR family transcriptional regulator [Emticicia agri]